MDQPQREFYVSRIIAGEYRCVVKGQTFYYKNPTKRQRHRANELYIEAFNEARLYDVLHEDECFEILKRQRLWTDLDSTNYETLLKAIEDQKVGLFERRTNSGAVSKIRMALRVSRKELNRLEAIRHSLDHLTCAGIAMQFKYRYLLGCGLYHEDDSPVWGTESAWVENDHFLESVYETIASDRLTESQYRELVRTEPWRSVWSAKTHCGRGVFDAASTDLSDEQRSILIWSTVFDSIHEHPECPADDILADDDMLDGWMILQRRKRETERIKSRIDSIKNEKIRNSHEIMFMADTIEDAREIDKMNDSRAAAIKRQRLDKLQEQGEVSEIHMPDTWNRLVMEVAAKQSASARGM